MTSSLDVSPFDRTAWQAMLDGEEVPIADAYVGVLSRDAYAARHGSLLVWRGTPEGVELAVRAYNGVADNDVAILLVVAPSACEQLLGGGLGQLARLVRRGALHPYTLMTLNDLRTVGLDDFVEEMGLVFPRH